MPYDFEAALDCYARDIAGWQTEKLEREMQSHMRDYPEFAQAVEMLKDAGGELIQKLGGDEFVIDDILAACYSYAAVLVIEAYTRGVLDGGRIYHVFLTRELPRKEDAK